MLVDTFLLEGECSDFQDIFKQEVKSAIPNIQLMTVYHCYLEDVDLDRIQAAIKELGLQCPVYYSKSYGILGFNPKTGKNMELMGKEVGTEYGCRGGDGGKGCTVVAYSGTGVRWVHVGAGRSMQESTTEVKAALGDADSVLVITDGTEKAAVDAFITSRGPPCYGGVAKPTAHAVPPHTQNFVVDAGGKREGVAHFFVGNAKSAQEAVCTLSFTGEAGDAGRQLLEGLPPGVSPSGVVGLFPCFTRGVNSYDAFDVEPDALGKVIPGTRMYGMFAHGEIGPPAGDVCVGGEVASAKHSGTSILAVHAATSAK